MTSIPADPNRRRADFSIGLTAMIAAALAMSISPSLVRFADVGPLASAFWRVFLALPVLYAWMKADERNAAGGKGKSWSLPILLSGLAFAGDL